MVVSGRDRHTQFCIGELVFLDSAGNGGRRDKSDGERAARPEGLRAQIVE